MYPVKMGEGITEIVFDTNKCVLKEVEKTEKLEDKYYLVKLDNMYGVYNRDYGLGYSLSDSIVNP